MIVPVKPKYTETELSLREEYEYLRQQLIVRVETELEAVTVAAQKFAQEAMAAAPVLSKQIVGQISNIRFDTIQLIEELKTLDIDTPNSVNLIIRLSNEYKIDNKTR